MKVIESLRRQIAQIQQLIDSKNQPKSTVIRKQSSKKIANQGVGEIGAVGPFTNNPVNRSSSQPIIKGKIAKGINYDTGNISVFTKAKITELQNKIQKLKEEVGVKEVKAKAMRNKIVEHQVEHKCEDPFLEKYIS